MLNQLRQRLSHKQRLGSLLALPLLLVIVMVWVTLVGAATVGPIQNASNDAAQSINAHAAQDPAGNVHVVWDSTDANGRGVRYVKRTWNGCGYTFGQAA